ncbi:hypothetical protein C8J56DRAFT_1039002 [Mycena floridula]|nr:hypothetical protein C8J56DRAFT_1039002 [Mycena floridula]
MSGKPSLTRGLPLAPSERLVTSLPVPGIPLNQQASRVYLHPAEADMLVTVCIEPETTSPYIDALVAEEAATIEAEMAKYDEITRTGSDVCIMSTREKLVQRLEELPDKVS